MKFLKAIKSKKEEGAALYISLLVLVSIFSIGVGVTAIVASQIRMARDVGDFIPALTAADSGIERALYRIRKDNNNSSFTGNMSQSVYGDEYRYRVQVTTGAACPVSMCIRSRGTFRETTRALEAAW